MWNPSEHPVLADAGPVTFFKDERGPYSVLLTAKCRKCDECRKDRQEHWALRAASEIRASPRTWFGTLTISPQWHERFAAAARLRSERRGNGVFEALPLDRQLHERHRVIGVELVKALKRLRKKHQFRFLMVLEAHVSGLPHYHMLLHEINSEVRKRELDQIWQFGFTKWRLVSEDGNEAWYVAKYLGKNSAARVRASLRYGGTLSEPEGSTVPGPTKSPPKFSSENLGGAVASAMK